MSNVDPYSIPSTSISGLLAAEIERFPRRVIEIPAPASPLDC